MVIGTVEPTQIGRLAGEFVLVFHDIRLSRTVSEINSDI